MQTLGAEGYMQKKWGIRAGSRKELTMTAILTRVAIVHRQFGQVEQVKRDLEAKRFVRDAKVHDFYAQHFNCVDLANRRWYSVEEHHHHNRWEVKLTLAILRFGILNAWTYQENFVGMEWKQWREGLASELKNTTTLDD